MRRAVIVCALAAAPIIGATAPAVAQEPAPAPSPPVANCDTLSAVVCQVPVQVNIGPIPVEIGSIFSPPPAQP